MEYLVPFMRMNMSKIREFGTLEESIPTSSIIIGITQTVMPEADAPIPLITADEKNRVTLPSMTVREP